MQHLNLRRGEQLAELIVFKMPKQEEQGETLGFGRRGWLERHRQHVCRELRGNYKAAMMRRSVASIFCTNSPTLDDIELTGVHIKLAAAKRFSSCWLRFKKHVWSSENKRRSVHTASAAKASRKC